MREWVEVDRRDDVVALLRSYGPAPHHVLRRLRDLIEPNTTANPSRASDEEIIVEVAERVARGELRLLLPVPDRWPVRNSPPAPAAPETPRTPGASAPPPPRQTPEGGGGGSGLDEDAQADTLERAAESGAPFCEECEAARQRQEEQQEEPTWVEFQLVDENGEPMSGEKYRVRLPDGSIREGTLDDEGVAGFEAIDPGECSVNFPDRHRNDWEPVF